MSVILPPQPSNVPPDHAFWNDWYNKLRVIINGIATSISWTNLNFTGSKIEDIVSRQHNKLQSIQGGATNDYYHLTNAEHTSVTALANPNVVSSGLDMTITAKTPSTTQDGGTVSIIAQAAVGTNKNGGQITIAAGNGGTGAGTAGGAVQFNAGDGVATGGQVAFIAGASTGTGSNGGNFILNAGASFGAGGFGGDAILAGGSGSTPGSAKMVTPSNVDGVVVTETSGTTLLGLYGVTPTAQHTTASASATFVANAGTAVNTLSTFDGYTIAKVVKALRDVGILQ